MAIIIRTRTATAADNPITVASFIFLADRLEIVCVVGEGQNSAAKIRYKESDITISIRYTCVNVQYPFSLHGHTVIFFNIEGYHIFPEYWYILTLHHTAGPVVQI